MTLTIIQEQKAIDKIETAMLNHPGEWMPFPYVMSETRATLMIDDFCAALDGLVSTGRVIERQGEWNKEYKIIQ